ncbi:polyprenyl synthetase family protein [Planctomycetaceae bacterium SH139]
MESATTPESDIAQLAKLVGGELQAQAFYRPIASQMVQVEQRLRDELRSRYDVLEPVLQHGVMLGGKRLRPALVLLSGAASGPLHHDHVTIATVLEMVHTATLVHDDVLDKAEHRRHVPTVNALWDNSTSILLGDFLFSHSFYLAATLSSTVACRAIGRASRRVCEGELRQVLSAGDMLLDEATYLELIEGKTAELTQVSCELGAMFSGASEEQIHGLGEYGRCLGIAFQIADDYLDLWGDEHRVGKTLGSDIGQGKATLPLIRALQVADRLTRSRILALNHSPATLRRGELLPLLARTDAEQYTRDQARTFVDQATDALSVLPPSDSRESLRNLAEFAIARSF